MRLLRNIANAGLAALFVGLSLVLLLAALDGLFSYLSPSQKLAVIRAAPDGVEARYVDFVLADRETFWRSPSRKLDVLVAVLAGVQAGKPLNHDMSALIPYSGDYMIRKYGGDYEGGMNAFAMHALLQSNDVDLIARALRFYSNDKESLVDLCFQLDHAHLHRPGYRNLVRSHCPPAVMDEVRTARFNRALQESHNWPR